MVDDHDGGDADADADVELVEIEFHWSAISGRPVLLSITSTMLHEYF